MEKLKRTVLEVVGKIDAGWRRRDEQVIEARLADEVCIDQLKSAPRRSAKNAVEAREKKRNELRHHAATHAKLGGYTNPSNAARYITAGVNELADRVGCARVKEKTVADWLRKEKAAKKA
jgi:hypothetical protein